MKIGIGMSTGGIVLFSVILTEPSFPGQDYKQKLSQKVTKIVN